MIEDLMQVYRHEWKRLTIFGRLLWFPIFAVTLPIAAMLIIPPAILVMLLGPLIDRAWLPIRDGVKRAFYK